ncbi:Peptidyl-tRNA hydrolase PTH2 [Popillia japonica]|uniref:peptidyl-tRNA hydrolase n=1 Tax=Popillia japonica TaxID=7064 RepID=A0AAW1JFX2_POPJA
MSPGHGTTEITDPVEEMLKKTGCIELHYKVQECMAEAQDWRKCQEHVGDFKKCMQEYTKQKQHMNVGDTKMVIIVRTDLKMGQGKIATQCAHAAVSLCNLASKSFKNELKWWLSCGQPKIVLRVSENCEETLKLLYEQAKANKLNACLIYDAGRTQIEQGTLTTLGIGPNSKEDVDKLTKNFKLL